MKKKVLLFLVLVSTIISLFACGNAKVSNETLGKGKEMKLAFKSNPTTGYDWEYSFEGDAEIVLDREETNLDENLDVVGSGIVRVYYFKANKAGKSNLTFTYRRPWENGEVAYDVVYELEVDKDLNIICLSKMKGKVESEEDLASFPNPTFAE